MVEKMYELKAKYEAEIARTQLKLEVLDELLALVPQEEPILEEVVESEEETETVDELDNL
jgi:hypothetical protein